MFLAMFLETPPNPAGPGFPFTAPSKLSLIMSEGGGSQTSRLLFATMSALEVLAYSGMFFIPNSIRI